MSSVIFRTVCATGLLLAAGGCATVSDGDLPQQLEVHAILDHREVVGVGCVLANDAGRWFVVAPGRVTVARSSGPLTIDCARQGSGRAVEQVEPRYDTGKLVGNLVTSAGVGYFLDEHSGAGFSYPATLTVLMHDAPAAPAVPAQESAGTLF